MYGALTPSGTEGGVDSTTPHGETGAQIGQVTRPKLQAVIHWQNQAEPRLFVLRPLLLISLGRAGSKVSSFLSLSGRVLLARASEGMLSKGQ